MSESVPSTAWSTYDEAVAESLAQQTATAVDVVKQLYKEEVASLKASATVTSFIGVIASRRVKRHLLERNGKYR